MGFLVPFQVISEEIILDRWSALIHGGRGRGPEVYQDAEAFLQAVDLPALKVRRRTLAVSFQDGWLGHRREFLAVTAGGADKLVAYLGTHDVGSGLACTWYLCSRVGFWQTVLEKTPYVLSGKEPPPTLTPHLDLFTRDIQVRVFTGATYTALSHAVELLMQRMGQNPAQLDHHHGFLGIT